MYQYKLSEMDASPLEPGAELSELTAAVAAPAQPGVADHARAVLVIAALPFLLVGLAAGFVWWNVKLAGRGLRAVYRSYAEAFANKP